MGIQVSNGSGRGLIFVDLKGTPQKFKDEQGVEKHGAMVMSNSDKTKTVLPSNSAITGFVTSLDVHSQEYQGDTISSLRVRLRDDKGNDPDVVLSVTLGSYFGAKIAGLLNAADLSKPITIAANTVLEGEKMGSGVAKRDNVFPTMRQGADNARLVEVWANGATTLPDAGEVKVSGKTLKDMTPVNDVVVATIAEVYAKFDALHPQDGPADGDDGVNPADVAAAAAAAAANDPRAHAQQRARG